MRDRDMLVVRFQGNEYLLIGDLENGGAIATEEQYKAGACSHAHLNPNGAVMRFGVQIGQREEIELIGEREIDVNVLEAIANIVTGYGWPR